MANALHLDVRLFPAHTNLLSSVYFRVLILFLGGQAAIRLPSLSQLTCHGMLNALSAQENILVNDYRSARVTAPHF